MCNKTYYFNSKNADDNIKIVLIVSIPFSNRCKSEESDLWSLWQHLPHLKKLQEAMMTPGAPQKWVLWGGVLGKSFYNVQTVCFSEDLFIYHYYHSCYYYHYNFVFHESCPGFCIVSVKAVLIFIVWWVLGMGNFLIVFIGLY